MNTKPLIGITCGTSARDAHAKQYQDRLNRAYSEAVAEAGGLPVLLPPLAAAEDAEALLARLDGLLLSGGYDFNPAAYGEPVLNETVEMDPDRDESEPALLRAAIERDLPLFAICRGIQTLNVSLGGSLYQDIPVQIPSEVQHRQTEPRDAMTHEVEIDPASRLACIVGETRTAVNSFHHQSLKDVAEGLRVVARAPDGVIEAVEPADPDAEGFLLGVQFHPEELTGGSEAARKLFGAFVEAARSYSSRAKD